MVKLNFAIMNIRAKTRFVFTVDVAKECFCKAIAIRIDKLQDWRYNNSVINNDVIAEREVKAWQIKITP